MPSVAHLFRAPKKHQPMAELEAITEVQADPKTWTEHAAMSAAEKAARPAFQAFLPALKPALIFECVGVPGLIQ